ncbi:efflux RND transporter periplasmic adaptor subunit [Aquirufa sp. ROCK-SH2]
MRLTILLFSMVFFFSCKEKIETIHPEYHSITESIYATGLIKSKNQYQVFSSVNGIVEKVFVAEGDRVKVGDPLFLISNKTQELQKENAQLAANYANISNNVGKINEAKEFLELAKNKLKTDSNLYLRQRNLWKENIGTKVELEQKELLYLNSKTAYFSAKERLSELKRTLDFNSKQSQKNLSINSKISEDFIIRSKINGIVFNLQKSVGEIITTQFPIATIGNSEKYFMEMQVDENDIFKIHTGLKVFVTFDSYKNQVFEASVSKIYPYMNEKSKSFLIEAEFTKSPPNLFPNLTFEANIVINEKSKALLIPRTYLVDDSFVIKANDEKIKVKTGLNDFQMVEILSGLSANDEIKKPVK